MFAKKKNKCQKRDSYSILPASSRPCAFFLPIVLSCIPPISVCHVWQSWRKAKTTEGHRNILRFIVISALILSIGPYRQAPKKDKKEEDEEDKAFKEKKKAEQAALKDAREKGTPLRTVTCSFDH